MLDRFRRKAVFAYPIPPAPRTAVLIDGFRSRRQIRVFPQGWSDQVSGYAPGAVAATLDQLIELARAEKRPLLTHAVIVLGREADPRVSDEDRDVLWQAFRVPLFEQILGEGGELLAFECEAHDGLHIVSAKVSGFAGRIEESACGCGRKSPRLIEKRLLAKSAIIS